MDVSASSKCVSVLAGFVVALAFVILSRSASDSAQNLEALNWAWQWHKSKSAGQISSTDRIQLEYKKKFNFNIWNPNTLDENLIIVYTLIYPLLPSKYRDIWKHHFSYSCILVHTNMSKNYDTPVRIVYWFLVMFEFAPRNLPWQNIVWWS